MIELKHTKGFVGQGKLIDTPVTIKWSKEEREKTDRKERLMIFKYAKHLTGRIRIAYCDEKIGYDEAEANARLFATAPDLIEDKIKDYKEIGKWLSAALEDENVCVEMKEDIKNWFKRFDTFEKATGYKISEVIE